MRSLLAFAPWLILGPVTGPLAAMAFGYSRQRRFGMAAICIIGIAEFWLAFPTILGAELAFLRSHLP